MCRSPILVSRYTDRDSADWRWFLAILCATGFYTTIVIEGTSLFEQFVHDPFRPRGSGYGLLHDLPVCLWGVTLAGFACSVVRRSRATPWWLVAAGFAAMSYLCVTAGSIIAVAKSNPFTHRSIQYQISGPRAYAIVFAFLYETLWCFPWIAMFGVGIWHRRRMRAGAPCTHNFWVILAATWSFASVLSLLSCYDPMATLLNVLDSSGYPRSSSYMPAIALLVLGSLLLMRSRWARSFALILAAANLAVACTDAYWWWLMSEYQGVPGVFREAFHASVVRPVGAIVPWLLIAYYAWRKPMAPFPDDNSPYPRSYCPTCGYNLHGITGDRCPECGGVVPLPRPGGSSSAVTVESPHHEQTDDQSSNS